MGQAKARGSREDRIHEVQLRLQTAFDYARVQETLGRIIAARLTGVGFGGPYNDDVALGMALQHYGLQIIQTPFPQ